MFDVVSIKAFKAVRGVAHCNNAVWNDVGEVEAEICVIEATPVPADKLSDSINH